MTDPNDMLDDEDFPAYTMGRAAEVLGVSQDFLRRLGTAKLIEPLRSPGGHRRYSRYQLRLATRARDLCAEGAYKLGGARGKAAVVRDRHYAEPRGR